MTLVLLMVLPTVLIFTSNSPSHPTSQHRQPAASPPSPYCRTGNPLEGVYHPDRFRVLSRCEVASGIVKSGSLQHDGDLRINGVLDAQYRKLLSSGNVTYQAGMLVLELIPQDQSNLHVPSVGQHITFVGPLVFDTENEWNAICPVWSIQAD